MYLLVLSVIVPTAEESLPREISLVSDKGICMLRLNDSGFSTILSVIIVTFTEVTVVPAVKVTLTGVEM